MPKRCDTCGEAPCKNPNLCAISRVAQGEMAGNTDGQCNGCRQSLPEEDSAHTKGAQCRY